MGEEFIAFFAIFCIFGLPVGGWVLMRYFAHRERMMMIERGMIPTGRPGRHGWAPPPGAVPGPNPGVYDAVRSDAQAQLRKGILTTLVGFALLIGLSFIGYSAGGGPFDGPRWTPGPWLLGGLIPMFVGIAQIITALISGASFPARTTFLPPPQGPAGPPPPHAEPGPYRSSDHSRTPWEELARPTRPPDQR